MNQVPYPLDYTSITPRRFRYVISIHHISIALLLGIFSAVCWGDAKVVRLSEPVQSTSEYEIYGAPMKSEAIEQTLDSLLNNPEANLNREIKVTTRVAKVCQKKGCFFIAQQGPYSARVSFKDYGFFVPSNISGRTVTLVGELLERKLSPEQAAHFNADAGTTNNIKPGLQYEIVANSVRIPLNNE